MAISSQVRAKHAYGFLNARADVNVFVLRLGITRTVLKKVLEHRHAQTYGIYEARHY